MGSSPTDPTEASISGYVLNAEAKSMNCTLGSVGYSGHPDVSRNGFLGGGIMCKVLHVAGTEIGLTDNI